MYHPRFSCNILLLYYLFGYNESILGTSSDIYKEISLPNDIFLPFLLSLFLEITTPKTTSNPGNSHEVQKETRSLKVETNFFLGIGVVSYHGLPLLRRDPGKDLST